MALIGQAVSEEKIFENGRRRTTDDGRTDDGRTTEHGYTISSPCEPDGSGELTSDGRLSLTNEKDHHYFLNRFVCVGEFFDG